MGFIAVLVLFVIAMVGSVAAAYYSLQQPEVGGLAGLVSHPDLQSAMRFLEELAEQLKGRGRQINPDLIEDQKLKLATLCRVMQSVDVALFQIIGHTDTDGGHDHNMDLSNRRAAAVENALRERGVTIELEHDGGGETEPMCSEDTDECHASNRRVEFLIIVD